MKELSIKTLIDFRGVKTEAGRKSFVNRLKQDNDESTEDDEKKDGGGDYWSSGLSAIRKVYKDDDLRIIKNRKVSLNNKIRIEERKRFKDMHQRNLNILTEFENIDFSEWKPAANMKFHKQHIENLSLNIKGLQIKANPNHVFSFDENGVKMIGGTWFIANLKGFKDGELGMYSEIIHRYLKTHFSEDYTVSPEFCIAIDVIRQTDVNYSQIQQGQVPKLLISTLNEILKLM